LTAGIPGYMNALPHCPAGMITIADSVKNEMEVDLQSSIVCVLAESKKVDYFPGALPPGPGSGVLPRD
jgi:hypothetical protein